MDAEVRSSRDTGVEDGDVPGGSLKLTAGSWQQARGRRTENCRARFERAKFIEAAGGWGGVGHPWKKN